MPGHVDGEHPEPARHLRVGQQVTELAAIGAGGVQADEGNAFSRFLEIKPVGAVLWQRISGASALLR